VTASTDDDISREITDRHGGCSTASIIVRSFYVLTIAGRRPGDACGQPASIYMCIMSSRGDTRPCACADVHAALNGRKLWRNKSSTQRGPGRACPGAQIEFTPSIRSRRRDATRRDANGTGRAIILENSDEFPPRCISGVTCREAGARALYLLTSG